MRTLNVIEGDAKDSVVSVEEVDTLGTIRLVAYGTFSRIRVQELVGHLTSVLRETADNLPRQMELPFEWKDGSARG